MNIPQNSLILVGDGQKALFLRNKGDAKFPNLVTEDVSVDDNPPTHEQGADRPGRAFQSAASNRRSSVEETDWHELAKHRFARQIASRLEQLVRAQQAASIVLVAPPRVLADLRDALSDDVKQRVLAEIDKDLTKLPVWEIEARLT